MYSEDFSYANFRGSHIFNRREINEIFLALTCADEPSHRNQFFCQHKNSIEMHEAHQARTYLITPSTRIDAQKIESERSGEGAMRRQRRRRGSLSARR
jgi:hypothetical protein